MSAVRPSQSLRCAVLASAIIVALAPAVHAGRVLFDATKGEMSGNADWVIDSDAEVDGQSNPARLPTPAQSGITASTANTYWKGGISSWGVTMVKHGNTVESLPRTAAITYGNTSNAQDLSHYKSFVVCEPNNLFTLAEKTAIVTFVKNGGGLFIVSDHDVSDRDGDGVDSVDAWNDLFTNNGVASNPFGMAVNANSIAQTSSNLDTAAPFITGTEGTAADLAFHAGATFTLSPTVNSTVKAAVWTTGSQTNTNVMMAYATCGLGRVVALGDSSPADDGTGDTGDNLFFGWDEASDGVLISNATDWLGAGPQTTYDATTGGSWANAAAWTGAVPDAATTVVDFGNSLAADATVTLDRARSAAAIRFDSTRSYTITGTSMVTFGTTPVVAVLPGVVVTRGSHTITAPLTIPGRGEFDIVPATSTLRIGQLLTPSSGGLIKDGAGRLELTNITGAASVNIIVGSVRFVGTDLNATASRMGSLFIATGATVDLGRSALVLEYLTGNSPAARIKGYLASGLLDTSDPTLAIGYAEAADLGVTSFLEQPVDATALLIRATRPGDTNLDLAVNFTDLVALAQHYNTVGDWTDGDLNYDGTVNFADLVNLAQNYDAGATPLIDGAPSLFASDWALAQSLVPEPASMLLALPILLALPRRGRAM